MSAKKLALLARLRRGEVGASNRFVRRGPDDPLRMSSQQRRTWLVEAIHPDTAVNNLCAMLRLEGKLDADVLQRALVAVAGRHQAFRAGFSPRRGDVTIGSRPVVALEQVAATDEEAAMRHAERLAGTPIPMDRPPLARLLLIRLRDDLHWLVTVAHHLVMDGWSYYIFIDDLAAAYTAITDGNAPASSPGDLDYTDYAHDQHARRRDAAVEADRAFWRNALAEVPPVLDLPTDRPRGATQRGAGEKFVITWDRAFADRIQAGARSAGTTPFVLILTAFCLLLNRYSGQERFSVGIPQANRDTVEVERMIGIFMEPMPVPFGVTAGDTFTAMLRRTTDAVRATMRHTTASFEQVVQDIRPPRDQNRHPLFQVMVVPQQAPVAPARFAGLAIDILELDNGATAHDLILGIREGREGITCSLLWDRDLLAATQIKRMAGHLHALIAAAVAQPDAPVAMLDMLSAAERRSLSVGMAGPTVPGNATLLDVVDRGRRIGGGAMAVVAADTALTHDALHDAADRLARVLIEVGVLPGEPVVAFLGRQSSAPVTLLAIMKAGGIFVPIDPDQPAERIAHIVQDSGARIAVRGADADQHNGIACTWVDVDARPAGSPPLPSISPDDPAYILYTSGSTGVPKGVAVSHRSIANLVEDFVGRIAPGTAGRLLAVTTFAFDIALLELLLPLATGSTCVIAASETVRDPQRLRQALREERITILQATPALWQMLIDAGWEGDRELHALCGGEAMPPGLALSLPGRVKRLWNVYGPTETTVWSTACTIDDGEGGVPIGRPLRNTTCYVVDPHDRLLPPGVGGELLIGGEGVAIGYWRQPELTAARFVDLDFGNGAVRVYRTGDRVSQGGDGLLQFHGRLDRQLKVRGFRIEPAEVEAALVRIDGIKEAHVTAGTLPGSLAAFIVGSGEGAIRTPEVRRALRVSLPTYMVPDRIVAVDRLPVTANGKIDRAALFSLLAGRADDMAAPPRNPGRDDFERRLLAVWDVVLGRAGTGIDDDFFDLGGTSMMMLELADRCAEEFARRVEIADLYSHSQVRRQADLFRGETLDPGMIREIEF